MWSIENSDATTNHSISCQNCFCSFRLKHQQKKMTFYSKNVGVMILTSPTTRPLCLLTRHDTIAPPPWFLLAHGTTDLRSPCKMRAELTEALSNPGFASNVFSFTVNRILQLIRGSVVSRSEIVERINISGSDQFFNMDGLKRGRS